MKWFPGLEPGRPREPLSCEEFYTGLRCGLPLRQPRETWAATISREIRCDSLSPANQRNVANGHRASAVLQGSELRREVTHRLSVFASSHDNAGTMR
jgi:hypothetical protein